MLHSRFNESRYVTQHSDARAFETLSEAYEEARYEVEADASLMAVLEANEEFGAFLRMVEAANLTDELAEEGPYTLFVPTNEAFQSIDDWTVQGQARANERGAATA